MSKIPKYTLNHVMEALADVNRKLDAINTNIEKLPRIQEINEFKDKMNTIVAEGRNQSSLVINELGKNNMVIQSIMKQQVPAFTKMFPIKSLDALNELENTINEENEEEFVLTIKAIVGKRGLKKRLKDVVVPEVLVDFNLDGHHNKMRLLKYSKFLNILFLGSYDKDYSQKSFKEELQHSLRLVKNAVCKQKLKEKKDKENALDANN